MSRNRQYDDDDGHVIAPMDGITGGFPRKNRQQEDPVLSKQQRIKLSHAETWAIIKGVVLAALAVGSAFAVVYFLVILALDLFARQSFG